MKYLKPIIYTSFILSAVIAFGFWLWKTDFFAPPTLQTELFKNKSIGEEVIKDFLATPAQAISETDKNFEIIASKSNGPTVQTLENKGTQIDGQYRINMPKNYQDPLEIRLDSQRSISITDLSGLGFSPRLLKKDAIANENKNKNTDEFAGSPEALNPVEVSAQFLQYKSKDNRKEIYYSYNNSKKLKNWVIYKSGTGKEQEKYQFENAKLKLEKNGEVSVYFYGQQNIANEQALQSVDGSVMERARMVFEKENLDFIREDQKPDFVIPRPYYVDNNKNKKELDWKLDDGKNILSLDFSVALGQYPIALDPTVQFTAAGQESEGDVIDGEVGALFGGAMASGDFNADGKTDLAVGAITAGPNNVGQVYIFLNNALLPSNSTSADVTIMGEVTGDFFGSTIAAGDFNNDGKTDLAVADYRYLAYGGYAGRTYIFHNDGSIPATADLADVIITGEATNNYFGSTLDAGDLNTDGKTDLVIGAWGYGSNIGRVYIFYNDGAIPGTADLADAIITGEVSGNQFSKSITMGDLNTDGKPDLVVGAWAYGSGAGRAYIFYTDGSIPTTAATADVIISGGAINNYFGFSLAVGDFNIDGRVDLVVGAKGYSTNTGRVYIFYNDGSIPTTVATADVTITGGTANDNFGTTLVSGDFNADSKKDFVVGSPAYSSNTGRIYVFYGDGSIPVTAAAADVVITGEAAGDYFGNYCLTASDFDGDSRIDLAVGSINHAGSGRAYIFYSNNGFVDTNKNSSGEASSLFGNSMITGDFNADGKTDLAVGAYWYSSYTGRVYIFYNDGSIPTTAATADVRITGEGVDDNFGMSLRAGDFNFDGKTDLVVGANAYNNFTGRAYIFYNDGSIPTTAATADVIIVGEATSNAFGLSSSVGDFNADGKMDLAIGAHLHNAGVGRVYIFYNDGSIPTTAATADVIITGEIGPSGDNSFFGVSLVAGDFNADSKTDLAVGAYYYDVDGSVGTDDGRAYIFYNDGSIPTTATTADVTITGDAAGNNFGRSLTAGDFNADGKTDLVATAIGYNTGTGRVYIFYSDGSIPTTAATADVIITGEAVGNFFGNSLTVGDLNLDGKTDLAIGAYCYSSCTGRIYIFYNDGSIPTVATAADVFITGEATNNYFAESNAVGDINADGKTDLIVGATGNTSNAGRIYFFTTGIPETRIPMRVKNSATFKGGVKIK